LKEAFSLFSQLTEHLFVLDIMRNESALLALRPELELDTTQSTPVEIFQNNTLRPILKMQHALLTQLFRKQIEKRKNVYFQLPEKDRLGWIALSVRSDQRFRYQLAGMVIGHFTATELDFFSDNEEEAMRRLTDLLVQRLQSGVYEV
jgi:hypothetical protein